MFKKILLPIENPTTCKIAMEYALDLAQKYQSEIVIFNAQEIAPAFLWADEPIIINNYDYNPEKLAQQIVTEAHHFFESHGIQCQLRTAIGDAAFGILETAESESCDLIVMCTHGMKALKRFLLGSVTNKVIHHASIPVLVVR